MIPNMLLLALLAAAANVLFEDDFEGLDGSSPNSLAFFPVKQTWEQANLFCKGKGMRLPIIASKEQSEAVTAVCRSNVPGTEHWFMVCTLEQHQSRMCVGG